MQVPDSRARVGSRSAVVELVREEPEEDAVDPRLVAPIGAAADTLTHPADTLRVPEAELVEAIDLHLEAMEAELDAGSPSVPIPGPGSTARPLTAAIRERRLTSSHDIVPTGSPSASITRTPKPSGSRCERATRSAIASGVDARETARKGSTSPCAASAARNGTSSSVARLEETSMPPR